MRQIVSDVTGLVGISAIVVGAWMVDLGVGIIATGSALVFASWRTGRDT